jgi:hypothetical protein
MRNAYRGALIMSSVKSNRLAILFLIATLAAAALELWQITSRIGSLF